MEMKDYLICKFGEIQGQSLLNDITEECRALKKLCIGEPAANAKTMQKKIFPRVAMYLTLQKNITKQKAYDIVWDYTKKCICTPTKQKYLKMEKMPFFFIIFRNMFLHTVLHKKSWSTQITRNEPGQFRFTVYRCLWNDTCLTCGCPELCQIFCDSDWENFGTLHKIRFCRTQTLGTGGTVCDFTFCRMHTK